MSEREKLYFLIKYTTGKSNDIIKGFLTISSGDSYSQAKQLLIRRFGDPHHVSDVYKAQLKKWPWINKGQSTDLHGFSDFLIQCKEAMKTMTFLNDLNSAVLLKQFK